MTFEEKVRNMKASEIIMAMVEALTHPPIINVNMATYGVCVEEEERYFFGLFKRTKKVCFGCAATNTICQISGLVFTDEKINETQDRAKFVQSEVAFLANFEQAIDSLRGCYVYDYNYRAYVGKFPRIDFAFKNITSLKTNYTNKDLEIFTELANIQRLHEDGKDISYTDKFFRITL